VSCKLGTDPDIDKLLETDPDIAELQEIMSDLTGRDYKIGCYGAREKREAQWATPCKTQGSDQIEKIITLDSNGGLHKLAACPENQRGNTNPNEVCLHSHNDGGVFNHCLHYHSADYSEIALLALVCLTVVIIGLAWNKIGLAWSKFLAYKKNRSEQQSKSKKDDSHNTSENDNKQEYQQRQSHKEQSGKKEDKSQKEEQRNYEEILGLSDGWTKSDLKAAYRQKCQQLHPDKWGGFPKNIALTMEKEYKEVQYAYKHLSS